MEFLKVDSVEAARAKLLACTENWLVQKEKLPLNKALGRVLAEDVHAPEDIPAFRRSMVDGYAVVSQDTAAAGEMFLRPQNEHLKKYLQYEVLKEGPAFPA